MGPPLHAGNSEIVPIVWTGFAAAPGISTPRTAGCPSVSWCASPRRQGHGCAEKFATALGRSGSGGLNVNVAWIRRPLGSWSRPRWNGHCGFLAPCRTIMWNFENSVCPSVYITSVKSR